MAYRVVPREPGLGHVAVEVERPRIGELDASPRTNPSPNGAPPTARSGGRCWSWMLPFGLTTRTALGRLGTSTSGLSGSGLEPLKRTRARRCLRRGRRTDRPSASYRGRRAVSPRRRGRCRRGGCGPGGPIAVGRRILSTSRQRHDTGRRAGDGSGDGAPDHGSRLLLRRGDRHARRPTRDKTPATPGRRRPSGARNSVSSSCRRRWWRTGRPRRTRRRPRPR